MTDIATQLYSDLAIPPGELLGEELEARGLSQRELARRMGRPAPLVSEIVRGKRAITPETALQLESVLEIPASLWVGLEAKYRLTLARNSVRSA